MEKRILLLLVLLFSTGGCAPQTMMGNRSAAPMQFAALVQDADWRINLKDFAVSLTTEEKIFALRVQDGRFLRFSGRISSDPAGKEFGPLQQEYCPYLSKLLDSALIFAGEKISGEFSLEVKWNLYPQSIAKWAKVWLASDLKTTYGRHGSLEKYRQLTGLIGQFVSQDLQPVATALGFAATGADMEKMNFQKAGRLEYYHQILAPAGILPEQEIPIPLMFYLTVQAVPETAPAKAKQQVSVDYIFATAQQNNTTLYLSYQRALDEYELNGDSKEADGSFAQLAPLSDPLYLPMAAKLLQAALQASQAAGRHPISLRLNVHLYPRLEQELIERLTLSTEVTQKIGMPRPELPALPFFTYQPLPGSGFVESVQPLLKKCGYKFQALQVSVNDKKRAGDHPEYENRFKVAGLKPDDKLWVPDIVYLLAEKDPQAK
ncbi:hypothetical protein JW933_10495 [candidate division FCPU426 bacterium]|nr:hypothetical protein [candidate division FCPU426 bacterium]